MLCEIFEGFVSDQVSQRTFSTPFPLALASRTTLCGLGPRLACWASFLLAVNVCEVTESLRQITGLCVCVHWGFHWLAARGLRLASQNEEHNDWIAQSVTSCDCKGPFRENTLFLVPLKLLSGKGEAPY